MTSFPGFIELVFPESGEDRILSFRGHWSKTALDNLESFEARELAGFLRPGEYLSPSVLTMLSVDNTESPFDDKEAPKGNSAAGNVVGAPKDEDRALN